MFEVALLLFFNTMYVNLYSHVEKTKKADEIKKMGKILHIHSSSFSVKRIYKSIYNHGGKHKK